MIIIIQQKLRIITEYLQLHWINVSILVYLIMIYILELDYKLGIMQKPIFVTSDKKRVQYIFNGYNMMLQPQKKQEKSLKYDIHFFSVSYFIPYKAFLKLCEYTCIYLIMPDNTRSYCKKKMHAVFYSENASHILLSSIELLNCSYFNSAHTVFHYICSLGQYKPTSFYFHSIEK